MPTIDAHLDCPGAEELIRDDPWWEIYRNSFPANEREPEAIIVSGIYNHLLLAFRARHGGTTIGIATTHLLRNPAAGFLVYLAVHRAYQDAGLGGALLEYAWTASIGRLLERGVEPLGMVWEVASPQLSSDPAEVSLRERRISFFRRHAGVLLPRRYVQPPVDGVTPVPMQLMFRACVQMPDEATLDALEYAMYFEKYGALNGIPDGVLTRLLLQRRIPQDV